MIKIILLSSIMLLASCGSQTPEDERTNHNNICIDGVTYVYFQAGVGYKGFGYMSVKLDANSKVIPCGSGIELIPQ